MIKREIKKWTHNFDRKDGCKIGNVWKPIIRQVKERQERKRSKRINNQKEASTNEHGKRKTRYQSAAANKTIGDERLERAGPTRIAVRKRAEDHTVRSWQLDYIIPMMERVTVPERRCLTSVCTRKIVVIVLLNVLRDGITTVNAKRQRTCCVSLREQYEED